MSSSVDTKQPTTRDQVIEALSNNVVSIPHDDIDDDTALQIGEKVLGLLANRRHLLPKYDPEVAGDSSDGEPLSDSLRQTLTEMAHLTPMLYLAFTRYGTEVGRVDAAQVEQAGANHTWLNAFSCVHPSDALKIDMGRWAGHVLGKEERVFASVNKS